MVVPILIACLLISIWLIMFLIDRRKPKQDIPLSSLKATPEYDHAADALRYSMVGNYTTGGDMDPAQKERTRTWFEECNEIPKDLPKCEPVKSHEEAREFIKKAYEHEENNGSYRFKMPEGFAGVDIGKGPSSTAWHVHLITDKGNVIVPGTSFLDEEWIKRAKTASNAAKLWSLEILRRSKGRRFSPSSNPLGDTAMFAHEVLTTRYESGTHRDLNGFGSSNYEGITTTAYTFRHKKGGHRG
jgi:hypothetical protein